MYGMMYSPDKMMMNPKPLGPPAIGGTNCFSGRYSPTYRVPEQMRDPMRRCMTNPPVRTIVIIEQKLQSFKCALEMKYSFNL